MYDLYEIRNIIQKNIHNSLLSSDPDINENILQNLKDKINIKIQNNSDIIISFSTQDFPKPLSFTFMQRRLREILNIIIYDKNISHDIQIALEESITNIIEHSYKKSNEYIINIKFIVQNNGIIIEINDFGKYGKNFDISKTGVYNSPEELREAVKKTKRGMGVYLMKKIMDNVEYHTGKNKSNKLIMKKKLNIKIFDNIKQKFVSSLKVFTEELEIDVQEIINNYVLIKLSGYLNTDTVGNVFEIIEKIKKENNPEIYIFDITNIEYISSSGIELFLYIKNTGEQNEKEVFFVGMKENIKNIFKMVGFLQYFQLYDNLNDAKNSTNK